MKPSSAMALVSAMPGAATPWAASFFSAWLIGSSFLPQPTPSSAATVATSSVRRAAEY